MGTPGRQPHQGWSHCQTKGAAMTSYPLRHVAMVAVVAAGLLAVAPAANAGHRPDISTGIDQGAPTYHDSGLDPTPYLGWNTFYGLGAGSAAQVKNVANFLVSSGMRDAGYRYVWLDGGWQANPPRDAAGNLAANPTTYPDGMPSLVTYLHGLGLKVGIYTDAGTYDPAHCGLGSGGHYQQDANLFASWQMDAVKVDFLCGIAQNLDPATVYA